MVDVISILFGISMLCGICCVAVVHDKSNEKLDTIASNLNAIKINFKDLNTRMKETERERRRTEVENRRNAFMAGVRVDV